MIKDGLDGNNINFSCGVMDVVYMPIKSPLSAIGVNRITISKRYCIVEFDDGRYIFMNNYCDYDDICNQIGLELLRSCILPYEIVSEAIKFLKDQSNTIKEIIKNLRVGTGDQFH